MVSTHPLRQESICPRDRRVKGLASRSRYFNFAASKRHQISFFVTVHIGSFNESVHVIPTTAYTDVVGPDFIRSESARAKTVLL